MTDSENVDVELDVTNVAHGGVAVARLDGRVVFVADSLPGERVRARVSADDHSSFWRAETVSVVEASPHRRPHIWADAALERTPDRRAGGAEFGHIELAWQRELKRQVLVDSLGRFGKLAEHHPARSVEVEPVAGDEEANGLGWRTRVSLHVDDDGIVGPYAARSHRVVAVDTLPLATQAVEYASPLDERLVGSERVDVVSDGRRGARVVVRGEGRAAKAGPQITERVGDREFRLEELGFWQVHHGAAETLTSAVQQQMIADAFDPEAPNLDLYGGVGLLAAAMGDRFGALTRVETVESDRHATANAAHNLRDFARASAVTARVDRYLSQRLKNQAPDDRQGLTRASVILDPPRAGAGKQVVSSLLQMRPAQLVYVACDPVAFSRDLAQLTAGGYELRSLRAFDLFPHTHHVEALAVLTPAS
ncbi:class I SAM-dependent RNA methyltransferase [Subtercola boreus]|uniref:23S rRNA methyltransferase n=1 Tax=Subtercola boreus TaxID=120213 RepID=A0A3E0WCS0_9MICO|nr:class I SAM-dependent RNA methyltransferase [Subtercola boreus]RFA22611.1 23S rRNA methyltransferase [Subtercola boreus]RFA22967.1 23S rRNA methyltransferase [Subtercola boreus]RFA28718.1 23S rRNA methyltransferase [Subtercola boreus]